MPLQDHFRPPLRDLCTWDSFHSGWAHEMVRLLNKQRLPRGFVARPHVGFARLDLFEVRIHRGTALEQVAAVELVSPRNKDRPDARRAFAVKCASYLQQGVSVVLVDAVTERTANLHAELFELLGRSPEGTEAAPLYAASYRTLTAEEPTRLEAWVEALSLGSPLPTLPLWLDADLAIPFDLEESYLSTFDALQIGP
jgi:hypothetical protein